MYKNNPSIPAPEQRNRKSERDHPDKRRSFLSVARCNFLAGDGIRINFTVTQFPRDFWHALSDLSPISRGEHQKASGRRDLRGEILPILEGVEAGQVWRGTSVAGKLSVAGKIRGVRATKGNINPLKLQPRPSISRQLFSERSFLSPGFL